MTTVFNEVDIKRLRKTHFDQLLSYIMERDRDGWYYGNKDQFEKRHRDLMQWVKGILLHINNNNVVIPKKLVMKG